MIDDEGNASGSSRRWARAGGSPRRALPRNARLGRVGRAGEPRGPAANVDEFAGVEGGRRGSGSWLSTVDASGAGGAERLVSVSKARVGDAEVDLFPAIRGQPVIRPSRAVFLRATPPAVTPAVAEGRVPECAGAR